MLKTLRVALYAAFITVFCLSMIIRAERLVLLAHLELNSVDVPSPHDHDDGDVQMATEEAHDHPQGFPPHQHSQSDLKNLKTIMASEVNPAANTNFVSQSSAHVSFVRFAVLADVRSAFVSVILRPPIC